MTNKYTGRCGAAFYICFQAKPCLVAVPLLRGQKRYQKRPFKGPAALVHALRVTEIRKEPMTNTLQQRGRKNGAAERPTAGGGPLKNALRYPAFHFGRLRAAFCFWLSGWAYLAADASPVTSCAYGTPIPLLVRGLTPIFVDFIGHEYITILRISILRIILQGLNFLR